MLVVTNYTIVGIHPDTLPNVNKIDDAKKCPGRVNWTQNFKFKNLRGKFLSKFASSAAYEFMTLRLYYFKYI